jgi:predicted ArsR family transcriptional regulator
VKGVNRFVLFLITQRFAFFRKAVLSALFISTARAFNHPAPSIAGLSADACLLQYALFTQERVAERLKEQDDITAIQERLYRYAYQMGMTCRKIMFIDTVEDAMDISRALYRLLGIDFNSDAEGITINHCYFNRFYSGKTCQVMSAMDKGMLAGLSGGMQLVFTERVTEGQARCRAFLNDEGDISR